MQNTKEALGFIGIGLMGKPMTLRLLDAGYRVTVWNRTRGKMLAVIAAGASEAVSIAQLTEQSQVILLSLADSAAVEAVVFGAGGIAGHGSANKLIVDLSSIDPGATRRFAGDLYNRCGMRWVDSPVSGGVAGAEQAALVIMAGGDQADILRIEPILRPLSRRLSHMGGIGAGQVTKICNDMIVSCNALVIAEMIALAKQSGIDAEQIPAALAGGFADSKPLQILDPEMATETFEPIKWRVKTLLKDLNMAVDLARSQGQSIPMSGLAAQLMQLHASHGYLEHDPSTLIRLHSGAEYKALGATSDSLGWLNEYR
ncbi:MAG: NAD(P)-dependent oxidoreductase [Methylococcaceae bacterium]|nr:NAD(P)-dependent oxidoreductase [Methylococcaceae bacterium]